MASYNSQQLNYIGNWSKQMILKGSAYRPNTFRFSTLGAVLFGMGHKTRTGSNGNFGQATDQMIIGGGLNRLQRQIVFNSMQSGTFEYLRKFDNNTMGGYKNMRSDDTLPKVARTRDACQTTVTFRPFKVEQAVELREIVNDSNDMTEFGSYMEDSINGALHEMGEKIIEQMIAEVPSDRTEERWDRPDGIDNALKNTGTYGLNGDRSVNTDWALPSANRVTAARTASVAIIEEANWLSRKQGGLGVDVMLFNETVWPRLKAELSRLRDENLDAYPAFKEGVEMGVIKEYALYNGVFCAPEAHLVDYTTAGSNKLGITSGSDLSAAAIGLSLRTWFLAVRKNFNLRNAQWTVPQRPADTTSLYNWLQFEGIWACTQPSENVIYTAVS